jgi:hypothetical protein
MRASYDDGHCDQSRRKMEHSAATSASRLAGFVANFFADFWRKIMGSMHLKYSLHMPTLFCGPWSLLVAF